MLQDLKYQAENFVLIQCVIEKDFELKRSMIHASLSKEDSFSAL